MKLAFNRWNLSKSSGQNIPKLILLHGMGGTGSLWRPIGAMLEANVDVLAPDQRGHGKSQIPHIPGSRKRVSYTPLDYGLDVIQTLDALQFYPTYILGHSMGVRTAIAAAHLKPEWVQGIVLVDLGFSGVAGGGLGENLAQFLSSLPTQFESRGQARIFMASHCPDPSIAQYLIAVSTADSKGHVTFPFDHSALIQTITAARDVCVQSWVKDLASQGKRILVLRGEKSKVWSHEQFQNEQQSFSGLSTIEFLEVANAGHGLPFEQRTVFTSILKKFMGLRS